MKRLAALTTLALALVALSASHKVTSPGKSDPGCVVVAPGVSVELPPSACGHAPSNVGSACVITTAEGRQIFLPSNACAHGPQFVSPPPDSTPSAACQLTTAEGVRIALPDEACAHMPGPATGVPEAIAGCSLNTPEGLTIRLPKAACGRVHAG
jgi:hypothetical protein